MMKSLFTLAFVLVTLKIFSQQYLIAARPAHSSLWDFYNIKGEVVIDLGKEPNGDIYQFSEDGFTVLGQDFFRIINRKGEIIKAKVPLKTIRGAYPSPYSNGFIIFRDRGKYGYLDTLGQEIIPAKYDDLVRFSGGLGIGRIKKDFYIIHTNGDEIQVKDTTIVDVDRFQEGFAQFKSRNGKEGYIDSNGKVVIPAQFKGVGFFSNGIAWARNEQGLIGYIDKQGNWVIKPTFLAAKDFDIESGLAQVRLNNKNPEKINAPEWVYIDSKGGVQTFTNSARSPFSEGLAALKKDKLYGFINNKGEWIVEPKFDEVNDFYGGFACVRTSRLWGIIDKQGNWVLEPIFEAVRGNLVRLK